MTYRFDNWPCYKLLHAGEGRRGQFVVVVAGHPITAHEAAEQAAEYFHDWEIEHDGEPVDCFDGTIEYIEVDDPDGPRRFEVRCEVVRQYEATETRP